MTYESLLNKEVARYTRTTSTNELGETTETWEFNASGIKCRLVPLTLEKRKELPGEYKNSEYEAYFLSTQTLNLDDRIKYNNEFYIFNELSLDSSGYVLKGLIEKL